MKYLIRWTAALLLGVIGAVASAAPPDKPMRLVIAYPAGGGLDFVGRTLGQRLGELWSQPVAVENRSGASGTIGADAVAKAKPDGLTLLLASPAEVMVGPIAGQKTPYDATKDLVPVVLAGETPLAIVAHASLPGTDLASAVAAAKSQSRALSYGTPGAGSSMHFAGEALNQWSGLGMVHVPYRGAAPAVNDLLGNQIPLAIMGLPPVMAHAKAGRLKVLAVTTSRRSPALPDVPAVSELPGLADYRFSNWMMLMAPAGTPDAVVKKIAADVARVMQEPALRQRLLDGGVEPAALHGHALDKFIQEERLRYEVVARTRGVRFAD